MAALTDLLVKNTASGGLRPFDVRRDLEAVANLVEQCFSDTLDPDGERYLQQMRSAAHNPGFLRWAALAADWASVPLTGFVWEEDGRLVGNISLIPYNIGGRRFFLIANVAVHPDYRRRGIARSMTLKAMENARRRGAHAVWLHVRENNAAAVNLYLDLEFAERARRTTWHSTPEIPLDSVPGGVEVTRRRASHWNIQKTWLRKNYPAELTWHLPLNVNTLRPGLPGAFFRMVNNTFIYQWSLQRGGRPLGFLTWQATSTFANTLWLAAPPESEEIAARALLLFARQHLSPRRPLTIDYPAHRAEEAIRAAGFYPHQTLIWMSIDYSH